MLLGAEPRLVAFETSLLPVAQSEGMMPFKSIPERKIDNRPAAQSDTAAIFMQNGEHLGLVSDLTQLPSAQVLGTANDLSLLL
jgi:hypothetical protein